MSPATGLNEGLLARLRSGQLSRDRLIGRPPSVGWFALRKLRPTTSRRNANRSLRKAEGRNTGQPPTRPSPRLARSPSALANEPELPRRSMQVDPSRDGANQFRGG